METNGKTRSSHPEVFCKKGVLRNFAKFTGKHLCQSLSFNNVYHCKVYINFIKKETLVQLFSCEFCEISKKTFSYRPPLVAASVKRKNTFTFRSDKEKSQLSAELEDTNSHLEQVKKQKANSDKNNRALEEQLNELRRKLAAMEGDMGDSESRNLKLQGESSSLLKQLEEVEHKLGLATKQNKALSSALSEAKGAAEDESKV